MFQRLLDAARPVTVDASGWACGTADDIDGIDLDGALVDAARVAGGSLPVDLDAALGQFRTDPSRSGALLIRHVPIGDLPPTPSTPTTPTEKDLATELALLTVARRLGEPVGYLPEHGGRIVQNIVPTASDADRQTSTSSRSNLMFHTETAFHPHRPRYLLLLCLRGDATARTTFVSIHDLLDHLADETVAVMFEPRFRTAVDASFLEGRENELGPCRPLITGSNSEPTFIFDADLTVGIDDESGAAVAAVCKAIEDIQCAVVLEPGDLLVIDNHLAVHGRSPFVPRFDGTDRWLQRTFVVDDLAASAAERRGRVIVTEFGQPHAGGAGRVSGDSPTGR